jgi:hypothetical protein
MAFTTDPKARKAAPVFSGVLKYFPDAIFEVAELSQRGNDQHNPGEPLHWAKGKSQDELDACVRHLMESGAKDTDGVRHSAKAAWRALANLQKEIEAEREGITVDELNARYKAQEFGAHVNLAEPCIALEVGKTYEVIANRHAVGLSGPLRVGDVFYANREIAGAGLSDDGFRLVIGSWVKVKPC